MNALPPIARSNSWEFQPDHAARSGIAGGLVAVTVIMHAAGYLTTTSALICVVLMCGYQQFCGQGVAELSRGAYQ